MINNPEWLFKCSEVCELLYGVYPLEILKSLYALKENDELNIKDINELFIETSTPYQVQDEIYDDYQKLGYKKGVVTPLMYSKKTLEDLKAIPSLFDDPSELLHTDEDELYRLLKIQGTIPFFVPNLSQIEDLLEDGYIFNNSLKRLEQILKKEHKDDIGYIFKKICYGIDIRELVKGILPTINIKNTDDINEVNSYVSIIDDVYINNNQRKYRGYIFKQINSLNQKVIIPAMTKSDYLS